MILQEYLDSKYSKEEQLNLKILYCNNNQLKRLYCFNNQLTSLKGIERLNKLKILTTDIKYDNLKELQSELLHQRRVRIIKENFIL